MALFDLGLGIVELGEDLLEERLGVLFDIGGIVAVCRRDLGLHLRRAVVVLVLGLALTLGSRHQDSS